MKKKMKNDMETTIVFRFEGPGQMWSIKRIRKW